MAARRNGRKSGRKKGRIILFAVEIFIILVMLGALYFVMKSTDNEGPKRVEIPEEKLEIGEQVKKETEAGGTMHGYTNIALFGLDLDSEKIETYTEQQILNRLYKNSRSDCIMIASINHDTGDIKLLSVYRDTLLNLSDDRYEKCTHAYAYGGAEMAMKMLNMNLDMDITKFVAVNYKALVDVIDALGGVWIEVDSAEKDWVNAYQSVVATNLNRQDDYVAITETGYQLLTGMQATGYCRIRQTRGDDFQRAARQREVLQAIEAQAKQANLSRLTDIFNSCIGYVYTNLDNSTMLDLLGNIANYRIVAEDGFPQADMRRAGTLGAKGSCVVANDLEANVKWLHEFFFDDTEYEVSDRVKEYSEKIRSDTARYFAD